MLFYKNIKILCKNFEIFLLNFGELNEFRILIQLLRHFVKKSSCLSFCVGGYCRLTS